MRYPVLFNFSRAFDKLGWDEFTTIRSVNYNKKHPEVKKGAIGFVTLKRKPLFLVEVIDWYDARIVDIPLRTIVEDTFPYNTPTHRDFVKFLNDLLEESGIPYRSNRLETVKRVFVLKRTKPDN